MRTRIRRTRERVGIWFGRALFAPIRQTLRRRYRDAPVPLDVLQKIRRFGSLERNLGTGSTRSTTGRSLRNPFLREALGEEELGIWSLGTDTLNFLESWIRAHRPTTILEMGSGVSTVCLVRYMRETGAESSKPFVYSIDQASEYADRTLALLARVNESGAAKVAVRNLVDLELLGVRTMCFDIDPSDLSAFLDGRRPELVVIDGPSGDEGVRLATLPLVKDQLAEGAVVFLDDAFRDGELAVAARWSDLDGVCVRGIHIIDKGLLEATVVGPPRE